MAFANVVDAVVKSQHEAAKNEHATDGPSHPSNTEHHDGGDGGVGHGSNTEANRYAKPDGPHRGTNGHVPNSRTPDGSPPLRVSLPDTPSARTGPPRSFSYNFSFPNTPSSPYNVRSSSKPVEEDDIPEDANDNIPEPKGFPFRLHSPHASFRGAFEAPPTPSEKHSMDKKGKCRESRSYIDEFKNFSSRFVHDSPAEERDDPMQEENQHQEKEKKESKLRHHTTESEKKNSVQNGSAHSALQRSQSHPSPRSGLKRSPGSARWGRLRSLLPAVIRQTGSHGGQTHSAVTNHEVNITDELISGGLSMLMMKLWFERDEKGHRRIPILFHRLRIRISDSLHALHGHKAVFRIECEYANGAARWVVYRQLRDFVSLHTHYTISNAVNNSEDVLPKFPRTSIPYFKFLKREGEGQIRHADFARLQREALEDYLIKLIRAVMFHPSSNRLAGFLEISALFISQAQSGGTQYKAGYLRIESSGPGASLGRKAVKWRERKEARWCAVRESYLVILEQPGELSVWDVFLLDSDFKIIRPTRYYRKGLHMLKPDLDEGEYPAQHGVQEGHFDPSREVDCLGAIESFKLRLSRVFSHRDRPAASVGPGHSTHSEGQRPHQRSGSVSSGSSASSIASRQPTPLLDPSTNPHPFAGDGHEHREADEHEQAKGKKRSKSDVSKHTFYVENSQMRLKLFARNERQMLQWITALEKVAATSHYTGNNRFDSFAPIRLNVAAQWLVDGRDYMWNLSRAILLARESIYIHDWWLSPELQMRRPDKDKYRLDHLLERKAKEGVKIHIILYKEVSSRTTPTDSNYTKQRLTALHPNIMVQRSPSHFQTGTFYWAHHEKLCVIDQTIAFMGGIDLCFGRWDTPQHVILDDADMTPQKTEIWPGKDYSNARICDFHTLDKPFEDMYDRTKVPRMPWHDVGLQIVGQPARDLARHFVERWNYLLRIKNHTKAMPFLIPPPEFRSGELSQLGLTGTCEMQICRSAGPWSLGTKSRIEHSIQNAYLKAIEMSDHFVYIENQFFITSTVVNDVPILNAIGDALVERIIRANREGTNWKCCIVIPLFPGFPYPVDHNDASAVRIILECQNRTICRGPNSIYARLRKEGIDPEDYISVFSLRNWAKMRNDVLTTEIVYIHGKVCIVDDRLAIIGSANINERSQRGDRDSELAAIIRDTDMIDGTMDGKPYKVGRFSHTLRVRLMREHIGVDVDNISEDDHFARREQKAEYEQEEWDPEDEQEHGQQHEVTQAKHETRLHNLTDAAKEGISQTAHAAGDGIALRTAHALRKPVQNVELHQPNQGNQDASMQEERMTFSRDGKKKPGFASAMVPTLEEKLITERLPPAESAESPPLQDKLDQQKASGNQDQGPPEMHTTNGQAYGAPAGASKSIETDEEPPHSISGINDADEQEKAAPMARSLLRKHLKGNLGSKTWALPTAAPNVDPNGFADPVSDKFWKNVWVACAVHNTEIYRKVFHSIPDDLVTTWKQYKEFVMHHERFSKPAKDSSSPDPVARVPSETAFEDGPYQKGGIADKADGSAPDDEKHTTEKDSSEKDNSEENSDKSEPNEKDNKDNKSRKPGKNNGVEPFTKEERDEMEALLNDIKGHLVIYPTRFLEGEDIAENFLFTSDRMLPMPIYD
ncbi:phospholipase D [Coniophora puteana RWD-64-598 SS2]|uniref:Phospholipase n=1 Tax=Coniophora puteana (strain RWD-64-598) TaxID=741705 RepID=A0A5M3MQD0_CONPW|nr:phospholipase D [Coniophora puteana RWD-64-598 SS2]EIW80924.1 phospholipase D [Coniophora puteana RWD-64-598 SS2]